MKGIPKSWPDDLRLQKNAAGRYPKRQLRAVKNAVARKRRFSQWVFGCQQVFGDCWASLGGAASGALIGGGVTGGAAGAVAGAAVGAITELVGRQLANTQTAAAIAAAEQEKFNTSLANTASPAAVTIRRRLRIFLNCPSSSSKTSERRPSSSPS